MSIYHKILLALLVLTVSLLSSCGEKSAKIKTYSGTKSTKAKLIPPKANEIYFGAFTNFGGTEDDVTSNKINEFETLVNKSIAWAYFSNNWYEQKNGKYYPRIKYPKENIHTIHALGKTPFIRFLPWESSKQVKHMDQSARNSDGADLTNICHQTQDNTFIDYLINRYEFAEHEKHGDWKGICNDAFTMESIISGNWDDELRQWAQDSKSDKDNKGNTIPLLVTFAIEMNGYWFPWSGIFNGGVVTDKYGDSSLADGPEKYRDAYRHIIDLFKDEDVTHITWFFVPDTTNPNRSWANFLVEDWNSAKNYYPGDAYIDWIGTNLYGAAFSGGGWSIFNEELKQSHDAILDITSNKPIALLEFGVMDHHPDGDKSEWLKDAFSTILNGEYINFKAISYWNEQWYNSGDVMMNVDSSSTSLRTFKNQIKNKRFTPRLRFSH
jgi:hypothetical protein